MFTATLTVPDLDFDSPEHAAVALLAAAGEARPLSVALYNQHTGEKHLIKVDDLPADTVTIEKPQAMGKTMETMGWLVALFRDRANDDQEDHTGQDATQVEEARDAVHDMLAALRQAEDFIAGFEGDEMQEGIDELLAATRSAIAKAEGR